MEDSEGAASSGQNDAAAERYVSGPELDPEWRANAADKEPFKMEEKHIVRFLGVCGVIGLGAFIGLIVLLCSIHTLGPDEQVVITDRDGKYTKNGPSTVVIPPEKKKVFRHASQLGPREYAVIKNVRTGEIRHQPGPTYVFLGAYEAIDKVKAIITIQRDEYIRLVDQMTGNERVLSGPRMVVPEPMEVFPKGVERAVTLGNEYAVLIQVKSTGMLKLITDGGIYVPRPYEVILEVRKATLLGPKEYAVVKNTMDGSVRSLAGPQLFHIGAYEELLGIRNKMMLRKDEYIRLRSKKDGTERVVRGPQTFIPDYEEQTLEGKQRATFLDLDTAALVLNRATGQQRLVTKKGVFVPSPYEQVLARRQLIRVLPHEVMVVRDIQGQLKLMGGAGVGTTFFLQPFESILEQSWSSYSEDLVPGAEQGVSKVKFTKIDTRPRLMKFRFSVLTNDNVKLILDGNIFWKVDAVAKMVKTTADPSGNVWQHSRSAVMQAVSRSTMATFMLSLKKILKEVSQTQSKDVFYSERGLSVQDVEITRFEVADPSTAKILRDIILESTNRINLLQKQASKDEVRAARLTNDIELEKTRASLVLVKATNHRVHMETIGDVEGLKRLGFAQTFIGGLNVSVPSLDSRIDLYKQYHKIKSSNAMTRDLATNPGRFLLSAKDLEVSLKMEL